MLMVLRFPDISLRGLLLSTTRHHLLPLIPGLRPGLLSYHFMKSAQGLAHFEYEYIPFQQMAFGYVSVPDISFVCFPFPKLASIAYIILPRGLVWWHIQTL